MGPIYRGGGSQLCNRLLKKAAGFVVRKGESRRAYDIDLAIRALRHVGLRKELGKGNEQEQQGFVTWGKHQAMVDRVPEWFAAGHCNASTGRLGQIRTPRTSGGPQTVQERLVNEYLGGHEQ